MTDITSAPRPTLADDIHTSAKALLSMIPFLGGPVVEAFSLIMGPPIEKRRIEWIESIAKALMDLQEKVKGFDFESLRQNEAFVTAVLYATQAAIRDNKEEKLKALRNAVLNVAQGNLPEEDQQIMFLTLIDRLTSWHLKLLRFLQDPRENKNRSSPLTDYGSMGNIASVITDAFPDLKGKDLFCEQIIRDLNFNGLIRIDVQSLRVNMTIDGALSGKMTETGDEFLNFISQE